DSPAPYAERRPRAYLICPLPRADPLPDLQEVFEVDLKSRRERVQDPVALASEGHDEVVLVEHIEVVANRLVVQRELRGEVVRVVRPVVENPQNPCAVDPAAGSRDEVPQPPIHGVASPSVRQ